MNSITSVESKYIGLWVQYYNFILFGFLVILYAICRVMLFKSYCQVWVLCLTIISGMKKYIFLKCFISFAAETAMLYILDNMQKIAHNISYCRSINHFISSLFTLVEFCAHKSSGKSQQLCTTQNFKLLRMWNKEIFKKCNVIYDLMFTLKKLHSTVELHRF